MYIAITWGRLYLLTSCSSNLLGHNLISVLVKFSYSIDLILLGSALFNVPSCFCIVYLLHRYMDVYITSYVTNYIVIYYFRLTMLILVHQHLATQICTELILLQDIKFLIKLQLCD